jgi:hypothetical protein
MGDRYSAQRRIPRRPSLQPELPATDGVLTIGPIPRINKPVLSDEIEIEASRDERRRAPVESLLKRGLQPFQSS